MSSQVCVKSDMDSLEVTVELFGGPDELADLKPIWNDLLAESSANTIFLTWEWAAAWWYAFGSQFEACILKCSDRGGRPVGLVPMFRVRESIGLHISGYA